MLHWTYAQSYDYATLIYALPMVDLTVKNLKPPWDIPNLTPSDESPKGKVRLNRGEKPTRPRGTRLEKPANLKDFSLNPKD